MDSCFDNTFVLIYCEASQDFIRHIFMYVKMFIENPFEPVSMPIKIDICDYTYSLSVLCFDDIIYLISLNCISLQNV